MAKTKQNIQKVKFAKQLGCYVTPDYGTFLSSITKEDLERYNKEVERLCNDPVARRNLFIRIGFYDKDGNVAEGFRDL